MCNLKLYRGFKNSFVPGEKTNRYITLPRRPLNTPLEVHLRADDWFEAKYGYKFRSQSLFCYGTIKSASQYGKVGIVEPIGEHYMCWSPKIIDFYGDYELLDANTSLEQFLGDASYEIFTLENKSMLKMALTSDHEIMLWCKEYFVFEP